MSGEKENIPTAAKPIRPKRLFEKTDARGLAELKKRLGGLHIAVGEGHADHCLAMCGTQSMIENRNLVPYSPVPAPSKQIALAAMLNQIGQWGINEHSCEYFTGIMHGPVGFYSQKPELYAHVLEIGIGSYQETFEAVLRCIEVAQTVRATENRKYVPPKVQCLPQSGCGFCVRNFNWREIDFGANWNTDASAASVREKCREKRTLCPGLDLLWACVYNPELLLELQDYDIAGMVVPGIILTQSQDQALFLSYHRPSKKTEISTVNIRNTTSGRRVVIPEWIDRSI